MKHVKPALWCGLVIGLSCQASLGQERDSSPTVRSLPVSLDGSNRFGLILEGFPHIFYDCVFRTIDEAMQIEFDGSELLIRRLFTPPCGGSFGRDDGLPMFIPISAVLPDQGDLPVPLPVRVEIECPPHLDECPSGPGLPPGLIGKFLVGQVATLEREPLVFEPGFWQSHFNPWRFFSFEKQAGQFIAAAGYAAGTNTNSDLRWSVGAASAGKYMEITFYEPELAACFDCGIPAPLSLRPIQPLPSIWLAFDAPNLAFLSDGNSFSSILTRAPLGTAVPPFGPLTGRFDVLDPSFPASWLEFDLGTNPQYGVIYPVDTDLDEVAELMCDGTQSSLGVPTPYLWQCELTLGTAKREFKSGSISIDSIYTSKASAEESGSYEVFAQRQE